MPKPNLEYHILCLIPISFGGGGCLRTIVKLAVLWVKRRGKQLVCVAHTHRHTHKKIQVFWVCHLVNFMPTSVFRFLATWMFIFNL